ncbi:MAG: tRNA dihydrouridine synthase DusB [Defluviitaleaceae bacterium]|nr:tRNA dihydrouridine synthase DusB [Defluviitaleaceae bacterium]MCL2836897.1 tRNA dihydrouridine synthase DusB [Defluviitaleaceae bacterium]
MKIGDISLPGRVIAAPMAGVTDPCFRRILNEHGAALTVTEMVSGKGLIHGNAATRALLRVCGKQCPASAQLFGREPDVLAEAALIIAEEFTDIDIIDINCGCPAPKIARNGEGSALMRDPALIGEIVRAVVKAGKPVTVKLRKGFGRNDNTAAEAARAAEEAGASAVCVHGRTASQMYGGFADLNAIAAVKQAVEIPVVGNGDIQTPEQALRMMEVTGCDAVMIGRGLWGNPWLVSRADALLEKGETVPEPTPRERIETAVRHVHMLVTGKGARVGIREARSHLHMYTKGLRGASAARVRINRAESVGEIEGILRELALEND